MIYSFGLLSILVISSCSKAPVLEINPKLLDFGEIKSGTVRSSSFFIKNTGSSNLLIDDIKGDCSCTVIKLERKNIAIDDSTKITITYTADSISNSSSRINFKKFLVIKSNSANTIDEYPITGTIVK